jgi:hypothetical protein
MHSFISILVSLFPSCFVDWQKVFLTRQEAVARSFLVYMFDSCTHKAKIPRSIRGTIAKIPRLVYERNSCS